MPEASQQWGFLATYLAFAFTIASGFYTAVQWFGKHHLSQEAKDTLTLWLWGEYESTWSHHFCNLFDAVFGQRHLSLRCFLRSSLASVLAVLLLYVLFAEILGVMSHRALGELSLWQAIAFGAAINVVPDYISLFETRWLLRRFERVKSVLGQVGILFADALLTGAIIWLGINLFQLVRGAEPLTAIEMLALFSVFSVFFYSTFLTSLWAWIYCLSTWIMRLFSRTMLNKVLDVENKPVAQVALVGTILVFIAALALTPILETDDDRRATAFDQMLCTVFGGKTCLHIVRFTEDERQAFESVSQYCESSTDKNCDDEVERIFRGDNVKAASIWHKSCNGGYALGCRALGRLHDQGRGVAQDDVKAVSLYQQACEGGDAEGCNNLGTMYGQGRGVAQDDAEAVSLYRQACDGGDARGCNNLGNMYGQGRGVVQDDAEAVARYRQACEGGDARGCNNLGTIHGEGRGVVQDDVKAVSLYRQACEGGDARGCDNLDSMNRQGRGGIGSHLRQECERGRADSCSFLATLYSKGLGGLPRDDAKATSFYRRACDGGDAQSCRILGSKYYRGARGVAQDDAQAALHYRQACEGGDAQGCHNLGNMYGQGRGLARDDAMADTLYRKACELGLDHACNR